MRIEDLKVGEIYCDCDGVYMVDSIASGGNFAMISEVEIMEDGDILVYDCDLRKTKNDITNWRKW